LIHKTNIPDNYYHEPIKVYLEVIALDLMDISLHILLDEYQFYC